jgi:hypothetical protein
VGVPDKSAKDGNACDINDDQPGLWPHRSHCFQVHRDSET